MANQEQNTRACAAVQETRRASWHCSFSHSTRQAGSVLSQHPDDHALDADAIGIDVTIAVYTCTEAARQVARLLLLFRDQWNKEYFCKTSIRMATIIATMQPTAAAVPAADHEILLRSFLNSRSVSFLSWVSFSRP